MGDAAQSKGRGPACPLLSLPMELRLEIYHCVVASSLSANCPHDIRGFLVSCRQIHAELEENYISKARPVLDAMQRYKSGSEEIKQFRLLFANHIDFNSELRVAGIEIPCTSLPTGQDQLIGEVEPWRPSVEALRLAMRLHHTTFMIQIIGWSIKISPYHIGQLYYLLKCLSDFDDGDPVLTGKIDRLILKCDGSMEADLQNCIKFLLDAMFRPDFTKKDTYFPKCVDAWVAMEDEYDTWDGPLCFGFDFVEGLEAYPGADPFDGDRTIYGWFRLSD